MNLCYLHPAFNFVFLTLCFLTAGTLFPFGEEHGDGMIRNVTDRRLFWPLKSSISNLSCPFYGVPEDTLYVSVVATVLFSLWMFLIFLLDWSKWSVIISITIICYCPK